MNQSYQENYYDRLVAKHVESLTGAKPIDIEPAAEGANNKVHRVTTAEGQRLITRTSENPISQSRFPAEVWALKRCSTEGLPVPEVIDLSEVDFDGYKHTILTESEMPGVSMSQILAGERDVLKSIGTEIGESLAKMHAINVEKFGPLDSEGKGKHEVLHGIHSTDYYNLNEMLNMAGRIRLDEETITRAVDIVETEKAQIELPAASLLHYDLGPHNILVNGSKLSSYLDFEWVEGGDPVRDLSIWNYFGGTEEAFESLKDAYLQVMPNIQDFEMRDNLWNIQIALGKLKFYGWIGDDRGIEECKQKLLKALSYFE